MEDIKLKKQIWCKISGQVQGVMYRGYTQREAVKLGITGNARNLPDGSVEIFAQGEEEKLEKFIDKLQIGSSSAKVAKVDVVWDDAKENHTGFRVY